MYAFSFPGLELAEVSTLPKALLEDAKHLSLQIDKQKKVYMLIHVLVRTDLIAS